MGRIYHKPNGGTDWDPYNPTEGPSINLFHRDSHEIFEGTVNSTLRMFERLKKGKLSDQEYAECLAMNSEHLDITPEELSKIVEARLQDEYSENSETGRIS